nr:sigma-70 family RNA polymerase sigma factor [Bacteroidota bacterium]
MFDRLYKQHYNEIYKFCFRLLSSHDCAHDLTQETYIKLFERLNSDMHTIGNARAWLYKVSSNLCLNRIKNRNRRNEINNNLGADDIDHSNPESLLIRDEKVQMVLRAINVLKQKNRILIMMYQDGLSYTEMSEATGIPVNSIGKTLWRSIDKISTILKTSDNE